MFGFENRALGKMLHVVTLADCDDIIFNCSDIFCSVCSMRSSNRFLVLFLFLYGCGLNKSRDLFFFFFCGFCSSSING